MKTVKILISLLLFTSFTLFSNAQVEEPVKWNYEVNQINDNEFEIVFKAKIEKKWHLYSTVVPTDDPDAMTPVPTSFNFEENPDVEFIGKIVEKSKVIKQFDPNFELDLSFFIDEAIFIQKITAKKTTSLKGYVEFMACNDVSCIPPAEFEFTADLQVGEEVAATKAPEKSLFGFLLVAFLAGLAALITPCVFPMIPMTVSFFLHGEEEKRKSIRNALIFGLSIILIYTTIGSLIAILFGADFANWVSTHWLPNVLFFLIFVFFAFSFFGMFEITLPSWMVNKADRQADKGGISGSFFMALTTVLVSFSCTGPIVGALLVESVEGNMLKPILGMLSFGIAFAIPFTFFAIFPKMLSNMPKSGGWLNSVKVVLGFLELALGLKFLSIADQTYHWGILDREVYLAIWIVIFVLLGIYLLGKIKFSHDSDVPHVSVPRLMLAIISFTFAIYLFPGLFGAPLKALSGYLPPQHTHDFDLNDIIRKNTQLIIEENNGTEKAVVEEQTVADCGTPKYGDFLHLPHGLMGYFDYDQGMECAKMQNKPVFIDFTGHGCVNCREMEARVWSDPKVLHLLREEFIVIALYVDDKKTMDEEEWYVSKYDGKKKKTIGKKNADFQISKFGENTQPNYVILGHDGEKLVEPHYYDLNVEHFVDFLQSGLEEFKKQQSTEEPLFKLGGE